MHLSNLYSIFTMNLLSVNVSNLHFSYISFHKNAPSAFAAKTELQPKTERPFFGGRRSNRRLKKTLLSPHPHVPDCYTRSLPQYIYWRWAPIWFDLFALGQPCSGSSGFQHLVFHHIQCEDLVCFFLTR